MTRKDPWPIMEPGDFRHRVDIEVNMPTINADGGPLNNWALLSSAAEALPAIMNPQRGKLFYAAQQLNADVDSEVVIRYIDGVRAKMRVVFGSPHRYMSIVSSINPGERNLYLHLFCTEVNG